MNTIGRFHTNFFDIWKGELGGSQWAIAAQNGDKYIVLRHIRWAVTTHLH